MAYGAIIGQKPSIDLSPYATKSELNNYALESELNNYVTKTEVGNYTLQPQLVIYTYPNTNVTAQLGGTVFSAMSNSAGKCTITLNAYGTWTITAGSATKNVVVDTVKQYQVDVGIVYGVKWYYGTSTACTRTDGAANFPNPSPAVNNRGGSSPFDNIMPWAGMVVGEDPQCGTVVAIPKFWYNWNPTYDINNKIASLNLQISSSYIPGFYVSPAHMDRGDGRGERDVVYVGKYHCAQGTYRSTTHAHPQVGMTRGQARIAVQALGSNIYLLDYATRWSICMLYLVEYADWDSQYTIGLGGGVGSAGSQLIINGNTDNMEYVTGTSAVSRTTNGMTMYRNIEGLWDNGMDFLDGIYTNSKSSLFLIVNPTLFVYADGRSNGTSISVAAQATGKTRLYASTTIAYNQMWIGFSQYTGASTYRENFPDNIQLGGQAVTAYAGGVPNNIADYSFYGLFHIGGTNRAVASQQITARLMKLP